MSRSTFILSFGRILFVPLCDTQSWYELLDRLSKFRGILWWKAAARFAGWPLGRIYMGGNKTEIEFL